MIKKFEKALLQFFCETCGTFYFLGREVQASKSYELREFGNRCSV
jgi:hypothetical protein